MDLSLESAAAQGAPADLAQAGSSKAARASLLRPLTVVFTALTLLTGLAYPLAITALAQAAFADRANGSLIQFKGQVVGSRLIGQSFSDAGHFQGRPSATAPQPYNGLASGGANLGPLNPALADAVRQRRAAMSELPAQAPVPLDLLTASASGLDPDISPAAARVQVERVAHARGLDPAQLLNLVAHCTQERTWGLLGEARVNVLALNLAMQSGRADCTPWQP